MTEPITIVQISDLHFGTVMPGVSQALIDCINTIDPQLLIISGDITQRARSEQFKLAREFFDKLVIQQRILVPGNHDVPLYRFWLRMMCPYKLYYENLKGYINTEFTMAGIKVLGINSCNPAHYKNGRILPSQLDAVQAAFAGCSKETTKILVAHHPVDVILHDDLENIMPNSATIVEQLADIGVDLILGGHIHYPMSRSLHIRYPQLNRPMGVSQAGTGTSNRVRSNMPNSFMTITVPQPQDSSEFNSKAKIEVQRWDYASELLGFVPQAKFYPLAQG